MRKRISRIVIYTVLLSLISFIALSYFFAKSFIKPHHVLIGKAPDISGFTFTDVVFNTQDGINLNGWYSKPDSSEIVVILLHGYSANRLEMLPRASMFKKFGYGVLLYDARACGESGGDKISLGYYEQNDLLGAIDFLKSEGVKQFGLDGFSQGGATIVMASDKLANTKITFAILESTYSDLRTAIDNRYKKFIGIPGWLGGAFMIPISECMLNADIDVLSPVTKIKNLKCPVLIISGSDDFLTKVSETESIYKNANNPKQFFIFNGAKHEDLYKYDTKLYEQIATGFFKDNNILAKY